MSHELFSLNPDLQRLRDEGYFVQIQGGLLLVREVPYVDAKRTVQRGTVISSLNLAGNKTQKPDTHQVWFDGEFPCFADGSPIKAISNQTGTFPLANGMHLRLFGADAPELHQTGWSAQQLPVAAMAAVQNAEAATRQ